MCVHLTELKWCVFAGVCKQFLWRTGKRIFSAKSKHFWNSCKSPSKTENKRILQSALLCVRFPKGFESVLRFREWEARSFQELRLDIPEWEYTLYWELSASKTKTEQPHRTAFNVCFPLTQLNWCVFAGVCKLFLWRSGKGFFPAKSKHFRNSCKSPCKT